MPERAPSRWLYEPAASLKAPGWWGGQSPLFQYSTIPTFQLGANELNSMVAWPEKTE